MQVVFEPNDVVSAFAYDYLSKFKFKHIATCYIKDSTSLMNKLATLKLDFCVQNRIYIISHEFPFALLISPSFYNVTVLCRNKEEYEVVLNTILKDIVVEYNRNDLYVFIYDYDASYNDISETVIRIDTNYFMTNIDKNLFKLCGIDIDKLTHSFFNSNDTILLLNGKPGIGKSKLALFVGYLANIRYRYCDKVRFVKSNKVIETLAHRPSSFFSDENTLFIFDDLDYQYLDRNSDSCEFISTLLTVTDGVIPQSNKFIITTNVTIKHIDSALLRPGRLFASIELLEITYEDLVEYDSELAELCKSIYKSNVYTLSQVNKVRLSRQRSQSYDFALKKGVVRDWNSKSLGF